MLYRLLVAIRFARPRMAFRTSAVLEAMFLTKGSIGSAERVAGMLGLRNRFQLARLLRREGLPPLHRLTKWVTVLSWLSAAECKRVSLCWMAFRCHRHPSACYRLVKQVTGARWEELQRRGSDWVLRQFLQELTRYDTLPHNADPPARFATRSYRAGGRAPYDVLSTGPTQRQSHG